MREVLAERGIEYIPPGFERVPKKKDTEVTEIVQEFTDGTEGQDGLDDETIVFVALDDNQAQVRSWLLISDYERLGMLPSSSIGCPLTSKGQGNSNYALFWSLFSEFPRSKCSSSQ